MSDWITDQKWEQEWWDGCFNSYDEETKQIAFARQMGIRFTPDEKRHHRINLSGMNVVDIGGGPASLLLKSFGAESLCVIDPCDYPEWVRARYQAKGIVWIRIRAEDINISQRADEVWIYNCLQHVESPAKVLANAYAISKVIRICEPVWTRITPGHPQTFTPEWLDAHLLGHGKVENVQDGVINGFMYFGVFKGIHFAG